MVWQAGLWLPLALLCVAVEPAQGDATLNNGFLTHLTAIFRAQESAIKRFPSQENPTKQRHVEELRTAIEGIKSYPHTVLSSTHAAWALYRTQSPQLVPSMLWQNITSFFQDTTRRHPGRDSSGPSIEALAVSLVEQGDVLDSTEAPWVVRVIDSNRPTRQCTGILLAPEWVLTSGHCGFDVVRAGASHLLSDSGYSELSAETLQHRPVAWNGRQEPPDLTLLRLRQPLPLSDTIQPLTHIASHESDASISTGTPPVVYGWGEVDWPSTYDSTPPAARHGLLHSMSAAVLRADHPEIHVEWNHENDHRGALFTPRGTFCYSDLGAPLITSTRGTPVLVAIASEVSPHSRQQYPFHCADAGPNKWARVSEVAKWLLEHIPRLQLDVKRNEKPEWCSSAEAITVHEDIVASTNTRLLALHQTCLGGESPTAIFEWRPQRVGLFVVNTVATSSSSSPTRLQQPVLGLFTRSCDVLKCSTLVNHAPWLLEDGSTATEQPWAAVLEITVLDLSERFFIQVSGMTATDSGHVELRVTHRAPLPTSHPSGCVLRRNPITQACILPQSTDEILHLDFDGNPLYNECRRLGCNSRIIGADLYTSPAACGAAFECKVGNFIVLNRLDSFSRLTQDWSLHIWVLVREADATQTILHSYADHSEQDGSGVVFDLVPSTLGLLPRYSFTQHYQENTKSLHFALVSRRAIPTHAWVHLAISQHNGIATLYVDGALSGMGIAPKTPGAVHHDSITIGSRRGGGNWLRGAVDELHVLSTFLEPANAEQLFLHPVC